MRVTTIIPVLQLHRNLTVNRDIPMIRQEALSYREWIIFDILFFICFCVALRLVLLFTCDYVDMQIMYE